MGRFSPSRWLALGSALTGVGAAAAVAYWIHALESDSASFWNAPGIVSIVLLALGILLLLVGFFSPESPRHGGQEQRGGKQAINVQAGRDIHIDERQDDA